MSGLVEITHPKSQSDSAVIVIKGFLSQSRNHVDFDEFSCVLDREVEPYMLGFDWDSGTISSILTKTRTSFMLHQILNKFLDREAKPSLQRYTISLIVPALVQLFLAWKKAKRSAEESSSSLRYAIELTQEKYSKVTVVAHSLGCRLLLNALNERLERKLDKVVLIAGALEEREGCFQNLIASADYVINRFTKNDFVLKALYRLAEFKIFATPIGITEVNNGQIDNIDCSGSRFGHGLTGHVVPVLEEAFS